MGVLIDTSVLIASEKGTLPLKKQLSASREKECFISAVTASELLVGVHRAASTAVRARRSAHVEAFLDQFPVIPVDLPIARVHARLWARLASLGTPIGPHDLWLAASALAYGFAIATLNVREFERVPDLNVERWAL